MHIVAPTVPKQNAIFLLPVICALYYYSESDSINRTICYHSTDTLVSTTVIIESLPMTVLESRKGDITDSNALSPNNKHTLCIVLDVIAIINMIMGHRTKYKLKYKREKNNTQTEKYRMLTQTAPVGHFDIPHVVPAGNTDANEARLVVLFENLDIDADRHAAPRQRTRTRIEDHAGATGALVCV